MKGCRAGAEPGVTLGGRGERVERERAQPSPSAVHDGCLGDNPKTPSFTSHFPQ
jgi:hypothetical protein